jgi:hypothetical protein
MGAISIADIDENRLTVSAWNDTCHLRGI